MAAPADHPMPLPPDDGHSPRRTATLAVKESLMAEIARWIDERNLRQQDAAAILGISRPRVSDVVRRRTPRFSVDALIDMLDRAGQRVELSVCGPAVNSGQTETGSGQN